jgi:hypothetical protein
MRQGAYTPDIAKMVLDEIRKLQASGYLSAKGRKIPYNPPPNTPIYIVNTSGETIPPFGCMQAVGTLEFGGQNYIQVDKPADTDGTSGGYLFNGDREVGYAATDKYGIAFAGPVVRTQSGSSGASAGTRFRPSVGSWTVAVDDEGQFIQIGPDDIEENVAKVFVDAVPQTSGAEVIFRFETSDYDEETPEECDEQVATSAASFRVKVIGAPCGLSEIPDADDDNFIEVLDTLGWLEGRDERDLPGRIGVAGRFGMLDEYGEAGECKWVIKTINMFRARVNVTEVVDETNQITIRTERQVVWDHCTLPDEPIVTTDCPENEYEDYSI